MAQSEKLKQMHTEQRAAAQELFKSYQTFIVEEFVNAFGRSYETPGNLPVDWRKHFAYKPQCEEFLIEKTKTFIHVWAPIHRTCQSPVFLKNLTGLISEYLSVYVCKKGWDRNTCTKYLKTMLFDKNHHVQLQIKRYVGENERTWGLQQKAKREEREAAKARKEKTTVSVRVDIKYTPEQQAKHLWKKLQAIKAELKKEIFHPIKIKH